MKTANIVMCALVIATSHLPASAVETISNRAIHQAANSTDATQPNNDAGISRGQNNATTINNESNRDAHASALFEQLDANKNGYIDPNEANKSAYVKSNTEAIDTDHDGRISRDEWIKYQSQ